MSKIILVTGAPASGKSTISHQLALCYPKSIHIQVDHLREMMVNGLQLPERPWPAEATRQFQWGRSAAIAMARIYASQGVVAIIDDVCVPEGFASDYAELFSDPAVERVLLLPTASALLQRLQTRAGPFDHFIVPDVPWFYSYLTPMDKTGWHVIDSSDLNIEATLQEVRRALGDLPA